MTSVVAEVAVSLVTARARPKSATLTTPSSRTMTFSGLMSRCIRPDGPRRAHRERDR